MSKQARTSTLNEMKWGPLCTRSNTQRFLMMLAHWSKSSWVNMSLHSRTLSWMRAKQHWLLLLHAACFAEKQQTPI